MATLHTLKSIGGRSLKKRVGRGGDRGKTSGRGTKGQKARAGHRIRPEMRDMIKKLPKRRGHGKNRAQAVNNSLLDAKIVSLAALEKHFAAGEVVSRESLVAKGVVKKKLGKYVPVKILGGANPKEQTLTKKLSVQGVPVSASAKTVIEKAGGSIH